MTQRPRVWIGVGGTVLAACGAVLLGLAVAAADPPSPFAQGSPKPSNLPPAPGLSRETEAQAMARGKPGPLPTRATYPTRTAADVLANIGRDPFYQRVRAQSAERGPLYDPRVAAGTLGAPHFVRALVADMPDYWIVPVMHAGRPVAIFAVGVDARGHGAIGAFRGWPYDTFPTIPESDARTMGSAPGDAVVSAELVWANVPRTPSNMLSPFWRLVRQGGAVFYLFQERGSQAVIPADQVDVR